MSHALHERRGAPQRGTHVLLQQRAFFAIIGIGDADAAADDAAPGVGPVVALITNAHKRSRSHVRVAYDALAVT